MFKPSVKTSTPAHTLMQILCLTVFWLIFSVQPLPAGAQSLAPADSMRAQVTQWLSQTHGVNSKEVVIAPLDERLKVQACQKPLMVDHPFASKETVRVRCAEPVWQLYLQVSLPNSSFAPAASSTIASGQNTGQTARTMLITRRLLQRGTILQADMLEEVQASPGNADTQILSKLKDAQQAELTRDIQAGQPLRMSDIRRAVLVKQGQTVMMSGQQCRFSDHDQNGGDARWSHGRSGEAEKPGIWQASVWRGDGAEHGEGPLKGLECSLFCK